MAVDYSPITDAISRLAAVGADTRVLMSAGFLGFSTASIPAAGAVRRAIPGSAWVGVVGTGLATAAVAALPLDRNPVIDAAHALAAGAGYALFVYAAAAAAKPLWEAGRRSLATISMCVAVLASDELTVKGRHNVSRPFGTAGRCPRDSSPVTMLLTSLKGGFDEPAHFHHAPTASPARFGDRGQLRNGPRIGRVFLQLKVRRVQGHDRHNGGQR